MTTSRDWQAGQGQPPSLTDGETEACKANAVSQSQSCLQGLAHRAQHLLTNSLFKRSILHGQGTPWPLWLKRPNKNTRGTTSGALLSIKGLEVSSSPPQAPQNPRHQGGLLSSLSHMLGTQNTSSLWHLLVQRPRDLIRLHRPREMFLGKGTLLSHSPEGHVGHQPSPGTHEAACRPRAALHPEPSACWHESTAVVLAKPGARLQAEATS